MRVAILDGDAIIRLEVISEKGLAEGWRPSEPWVEAGEDWKAGGSVIDGVYTAPVEPVVIPDRVTARQFKLQLLADGLLDPVEAWIATQDRAIQVAYANSGTFVRGEPMLQAGFAGLGLTEEQGDAFFTAAAAI